jgi:hypothetical protein
MNAQDMLDLALGQLDDPRRAALERQLADDPVEARRYDRLVGSLHQLLDDGQGFEPSADLARRTLAYVAENRRRRRSLLDFVPAMVPFRWADVAVAATILVAGLLTLLPAMHRSRDRTNQAACVFNLHQLGLGLAQYGHLHRAYPYEPADCPKAAAGTFAVMLHEAGLLDDPKLLDCPSNGACLSTAMPRLKTVCDLQRKDPEASCRLFCWDYAYHAGYRDGDGAHALSDRTSAAVPLLADQPPHQADVRRILPGNSPNHGGRGQNVLFTDFHVGWHNSRRVGPHDHDMFLNQKQEAAAGLNELDAVLLPSIFPFSR